MSCNWVLDSSMKVVDVEIEVNVIGWHKWHSLVSKTCFNLI